MRCFIVAFIFFSVACNNAINVGLPPLKYGSFKSLEAPTTSYQVGYVFRIPDNSADQVYVTSLNIDSAVKKSPIAFPSTMQKWALSTMFNFMAGAGKVSASGSGNDDRMVDASVGLDSCTLSQVPEVSLDEVLQAAGIKFKKGSKYYVISETISAKIYLIRFSKSSSTAASAKIVTEKAQTDAGIKAYFSDSTVLVKNFETPYQVLYKILEFDNRGAKIGGGKTFLFREAKEVFIREHLRVNNK